MAIIDRKKLLQQYEWRKLSASARALLDTFERFTDKSGRGSPTWGGLMYYSGIAGKDTFRRARKQLVDIGLVSIITKSWSIIERDSKKMPRSRITYQITESILWNKSPSNQSKPSNSGDPQSMNSGSMDLRKEGVSYLDVNNNLDASNKPSAGSNQIKQEKIQSGSHSLVGISFGGNQESSASVSIIDGDASMEDVANEIFGGIPSIIGTATEWRDSATIIAKYLGFNPEGDNEWYGFFKNVYENGKQEFLNEAVFYTECAIGDSDIKDIRKVFFSNFYAASKEVEE